MKALALLLVAALPLARATAQTSPRSSGSGVYSMEQASRGQDVYLGQCRSCHVPDAHASAAFQSVWNGRPLAELYAYLRERMPKSEPGTLSDQEYADVLSYLLRLNRMPPGDAELPADAEAMKQIRFEANPIPVRKEP
jgi:mono/diheme cytochrome c family protein